MTFSQMARSISRTEVSSRKARDVDHIVETAIGLERLVHHPLDKRCVREIALDVTPAPAATGPAARIRLDVDHGHVGALGQQIVGDPKAHSAARSGDERGLALEFHVPSPL